MTIRYDEIYVTVQRGHAASNDMIGWLTSNNIAVSVLTYSPEDIDDALYPLSTWFEDDNQNKIVFGSAPVLYLIKFFGKLKMALMPIEKENMQLKPQTFLKTL